MAEIIERVYPITGERTEEVEVSSVYVLLPGDIVLPGDGDSKYPRVRRTVTEELEGSVTLRLTEVEASVILAVLGRTNGRGNQELGEAAFAVYCALDAADLQTDYIKVMISDGTSPTLKFQYDKDDRVYA